MTEELRDINPFDQISLLLGQPRCGFLARVLFEGGSFPEIELVSLAGEHLRQFVNTTTAPDIPSSERFDIKGGLRLLEECDVVVHEGEKWTLTEQGRKISRDIFAPFSSNPAQRHTYIRRTIQIG